MANQVVVPRYGTRNLAVRLDAGARTVLPGTNVTFTTDPVTGDITINSTAGGSGTVTSVGLAAPTGFTVSGSPVTTTGTLTFSYTAGYVGYTTAEQTKLAGIAPGATANLGTVTSVNLGASTGLTPSGGPVTTSGSLTYTLSANLQAWSGVTVASKADLNSPIFTGDPRAPTPATADNDTSIATTAFVKNQGYATVVSLGDYIAKANGTNSLTATTDWRIAAATGVGFDTLAMRFVSGGSFNPSRGAILELNGVDAASSAGAFRLLGGTGGANIINVDAAGDLTVGPGPSIFTGNTLVSKSNAVAGVGVSGTQNGGIANYAAAGVGDVGVFSEHAAGTVRVRPNGRISTVGQTIFTTTDTTLTTALTGTSASMSSTITAGGVIQSNSGVIRAQGYGGNATSGVLYVGDVATDAYVYRPGGINQLIFKYGSGSATLDNTGTIWTTGNFNPATKLNYRASLDVAAATPTGTDWNNATDNGWYMASAAANAPHAGWNMGRVSHHNTDWIQQEVWDFTANADTTKYRRHKQAGTWGAWTINQFFGAHIFVGKWGGGSNYGGVMSHNEKYLIMTGTADVNTYVGAKATGNVVIRANDNDGSREVRITAAGGFEATQTISDVAGNVRDIPQDLANTSFTLVIGDAGRHVISTNTTNYNWTIPTNASVPFPVGTAVTFVHDSTSGTKTIVRAGGVALINGTTDADFALTAGMVRTILKVGSDRWRVV